jgi:hypothetical protein
MKMSLPSPHYSTLCRRARRLELSLAQPQKIRHLVIDSTGLKLSGEGEWKVRLHGADRRTTWPKLHLAMDAERWQITSALITNKEELDRYLLSPLLKQSGAELRALCAAGAYDFEQCSRAIKSCEAVPLIPPRSDAVVRGKSPFEQRDQNVREISKLGRKQWKQVSGYHKRSVVECAFFRLKTIFSEKFKARLRETQKIEAELRCLALNKMTKLGMPKSYRI